jgi:RNA polymerase sigma-70 factor (ECF subfamily)
MLPSLKDTWDARIQKMTVLPRKETAEQSSPARPDGLSWASVTTPGPDSADSVDRSDLVRRLFEEHNQSLIRFLAAKLHSEAEASDVAQEAYVRLLQLDQPGAISYLRAYLFRIAANIAADHLRRRAVRERSQPDEIVLFEQLLARPGPEHTAIGRQQLAIVKEATKALPRKTREIFVLHIFADRSIKELAAERNLTRRMIRNHVARGLAHCRQALDEAGALSRQNQHEQRK